VHFTKEIVGILVKIAHNVCAFTPARASVQSVCQAAMPNTRSMKRFWPTTSPFGYWADLTFVNDVHGLVYSDGTQCAVDRNPRIVTARFFTRAMIPHPVQRSEPRKQQTTRPPKPPAGHLKRGRTKLTQMWRLSSELRRRTTGDQISQINREMTGRCGAGS
jgi:hypothetical protein